MLPRACVKWYEAALIGGAIVGIYSILAASRDNEEDGEDKGGEPE